MNILDIYIKEYVVDTQKIINDVFIQSSINEINMYEAVNTDKIKQTISDGKTKLKQKTSGINVEKIKQKTTEVINAIIKKIIDLKNTLIRTMKKMFRSKEVQKVQEEIKAMPVEEKKQEVKIPDYEPVRKLEKDTVIQINMARDPKEVDQIIKDYKKKRNKRIRRGIFTVISVAGIGTFLGITVKKRMDAQQKVLDDSAKELNIMKKKYEIRTRTAQGYKRQLDKMKGVNPSNSTIDDGVDEVSEETILTTKKSQAKMIVVADAGHTLTTCAKDCIQAVSGKGNPIKKAMNVKKTISTAKENLADSPNRSKNIIKLKSLKEKLTNQKESLKEYKRKNPLTGDRDKDTKIKKNIKERKGYMRVLFDEYKLLKDELGIGSDNDN